MTVERVLSGELRWHIAQGDCRDTFPLLPSRSVDQIICDPPYSARVHAKSRAGARTVPLLDGQGRMSHSAISRAADFGFDHLNASLRRRCAKEFARISKRWTLAFSDLESSVWWRFSVGAAGLDWVRTGVWVKEGCTPQFTGDRPAVGCEAITIAHQPGKKRWNGGGKRGVWTVPIELDRYGHRNVVRVHPTQKPLKLMLELVEDFTDPDDIVFDPFCGAGTTGVACLRLGRRFIGCELDPKHFANTCERLEAESRGLSLSAARAGQRSLFELGGQR